MTVMTRGRRGAIGALIALSIGAGLLGPVNPLAPAVPAAATPVNQVQWRPMSGAVNAIATGSDGTHYLGGTFTAVGIATGGGAVLGASSGQVDRTFPRIEGTVSAVVPDGAGGWFIGGATKIGLVAQTGLAHLNADGSLDRGWAPVITGSVFALAMSADGSTLYVGGSFTSVNGQPRNRLAALSTSTGAVTGWDPNVNNSVRTLTVSGSTVYAGGDFNGANSVNGNTTRNRLAAFDATTGAVVQSFDPNVSGTVRALAVSGSTVYAGGAFNGANSVNGNTTRNRLAAFSTTTGAVVSGWDPNVSNGTVYALAVSGSTVYAGGDFNGANSVNGNVTRNRLAAFSTTTGVVSGWDPNVSNGTVWGLGVLGSTVYAGGGFYGANSVNGNVTRNRLAAFSTTSGTVVSGWDPNVYDATVYSLAVSSAAVYAGGNMTMANVTLRNRAAAIDANGALTGWNPNINGTVFSLAVSGSGSTTTVYAGGQFNGANSVNGNVTRNRLAAFDASGTVVSAWNPNVSAGTDGVVAMAVSNDGNTLYIGGDFTQVGGSTSYARLIAVPTAGAGAPITTWLPAPSAKVNVLALSADGNTLYVGGGFTTIGGQPRNSLAALGASTASVSVASWDPNVHKASGTSNVQALALSGTTSATTVYAGGDFTQVNATNVSRNNAAAFDSSGTVVSTWNPNLTAQVSAVALSGSTVYLGGWFTGFLKAVDATTAAAVAWNPSVSPSSVNAVVATPTTVYAGGNTTGIGAVPGMAYYAAIPATLPPVLASVSWSTFGPSGPTGGGGTLNLVGDGFVTGMTVTVGGANCAVSGTPTATAAACTLPSGTAGARDVVVTTPAGTATLTGGFTYLATPTVTGVSPTFGPPAGGTTITLTGTGFFPWMSAKVDTAACTSIGWVSATSITCVTPVGTGTVDVSVTTAAGTGTKTRGYTYGTAPATPMVTFLANGGTGSMTAQQSTTPAVLNANTFTPPANSVFVGWDTASGGGGTSFGAGAVYDFTADITLYAQWVSTSAGEVVTFDANGGTGTAAWQQSAVATPLTANAFTMPGMVFAGWNSQAGGGGTAYADQETYLFATSIVLYAQWVSAAPAGEEKPPPPPLLYSILSIAGACPDGWSGPSWQWWPHDGLGDETCNLFIPWSVRLNTYAFDPAEALRSAREWERSVRFDG